VYPEERIRVNFQPLERERFAKYFFEVWDALSARESELGTLPRYLQLLTLVSFHAFIREGVNAAVYKTRYGGEFDATNVIRHPVVAVITPLGIDYVRQLGPTIKNIAWHKAGIFKQGCRAVSAAQEESAANVIRRRAAEKGGDVLFVDGEDVALLDDAPLLRPGVQRVNCSVALAAVRCFLEERVPADGVSISREDIRQAIGRFSWPGRFQKIVEGWNYWFLDGAHNEMGVERAAQWFVEESEEYRYGISLRYHIGWIAIIINT
jgi:folylpolyglutamate synthase